MSSSPQRKRSKNTPPPSRPIAPPREETKSHYIPPPPPPSAPLPVRVDIPQPDRIPSLFVEGTKLNDIFTEANSLADFLFYEDISNSMEICNRIRDKQLPQQTYPTEEMQESNITDQTVMIEKLTFIATYCITMMSSGENKELPYDNELDRFFRFDMSPPIPMGRYKYWSTDGSLVIPIIADYSSSSVSDENVDEPQAERRHVRMVLKVVLIPRSTEYISKHPLAPEQTRVVSFGKAKVTFATDFLNEVSMMQNLTLLYRSLPVNQRMIGIPLLYFYGTRDFLEGDCCLGTMVMSRMKGEHVTLILRRIASLSAEKSKKIALAERLGYVLADVIPILTEMYGIIHNDLHFGNILIDRFDIETTTLPAHAKVNVIDMAWSLILHFPAKPTAVDLRPSTSVYDQIIAEFATLRDYILLFFSQYRLLVGGHRPFQPFHKRVSEDDLGQIMIRSALTRHNHRLLQRCSVFISFDIPKLFENTHERIIRKLQEAQRLIVIVKHFIDIKPPPPGTEYHDETSFMDAVSKLKETFLSHKIEIRNFRYAMMQKKRERQGR